MSSSEPVYLTPKGERVIITKVKQYPIHPHDPEWLQEIHRKSNEGEQVVRIRDGHVLWGITRADLQKAP